jgi:hypothetical protein
MEAEPTLLFVTVPLNSSAKQLIAVILQSILVKEPAEILPIPINFQVPQLTEFGERWEQSVAAKRHLLNPINPINPKSFPQ